MIVLFARGLPFSCVRMRKYQGKNTIAEGMRSGTCRSGIRDRWCKDNTTTTNDEEEEEKEKKEEEIENA